MASIEQRLDEMERRIKEPNFRKTEGYANEANYWVFDYAPECELIVRDRVKYLKNKNSKGTDGFELVEYDLYNLITEYIKSKNFVDKCSEIEEKNGIIGVRKSLNRSLRMFDDDNWIVKYIEEHTPLDSIVFLTGVGKCYPLLQGEEVFNKILYKVPKKFNKVPKILFYPGTYTERELIIFNEYQEDNYYRAFRLVR
jgi:hypothetical protein